ncbi:MAG: GH3 auxin-responsive promoter family protein, partial [Bacteroidales bacterium]|nr:GH3 auxin-responsive promoter family protein [Bacteroidales bacterium]
GRNYAMVISTNSGLWRYIIGDTVTFTSLKPYRIQITGRTKNFINVCGEELIVDNAIQAMHNTCTQLGCVVKEFTAAPYFSDDGKPIGHQWLVEFEQTPADSDLFAATLDKNLQLVNTDYQSKRYKDFILRPLLLTVAPQGTFFEWQRQRNRLGGQSKVPRLNNTRETLDPLLEIAELVRNSLI